MLGLLFSCYLYPVSLWPYVAIPFSYSHHGGFFVSSDSPIRLHENESFRTTKLSHNIVSIALDKKTICLNNKKISHHDVVMWGKQCMVNSTLPCKSVHFFVERKKMNGYFFVSKKDYKKYLYKQCFALSDTEIAEKAIVCDLQNLFAQVASKKQIIVRVLVSKAHAGTSTRWQFSSPKGFWIYALCNNSAKKIFCRDAVVVVVKNGRVVCNGKKVDHSIKIEPLCGYADYDGVAYDGFFSLATEKNAVLCINHVDLEDYITAVLRTESWPGWPLEVNKAFAITCRSYVTAKIGEAQKTDHLFHIKNTNEHQTYKGRHNVTVLKQAVAHTKGVVLGFDQKPILAMFDSCCGGIVPAHIDDFDFKKAPYLAREHACTYCKHCSLYSWQVSYDWHTFEKIMKQHDNDIHRMYDICVSKKDKAGLVGEIMVKGPMGQVMITGKQMYSLLKEIKSFHFDIHKKAGKIIVSGKGYGHHIGLCQWGARQMVRDGWDYKAILQFYYPGTNFMKLA